MPRYTHTIRDLVRERILFEDEAGTPENARCFVPLHNGIRLITPNEQIVDAIFTYSKTGDIVAFDWMSRELSLRMGTPTENPIDRLIYLRVFRECEY